MERMASCPTCHLPRSIHEHLKAALSQREVEDAAAGADGPNRGSFTVRLNENFRMSDALVSFHSGNGECSKCFILVS